ncbi:MAG: ATP-binding protein [Planctomycetota bacterium]|nr:ATP-binding protein [Planctomycetota bacterium]
MARTAQQVLTVPSDTKYLAKVRKVVMEVLADGSFPPTKANLIALAVDEAVANIIEHAYGRRPGDPAPNGDEIVLVLNLRPDRFEVTIRDKGTGFDPRGAPGVDLREHVQEGRKGGLGIFLIKRIMDEVQYESTQGSQNELRLIKYVDEAAGANKSRTSPSNDGRENRPAS